jgi:hypothetical protein
MHERIEAADDKEFNRVWAIVKEIGEEERHFNEIQAGYRNMASTWLLATIGAIGYVISTPISLNIDVELLIAGIAGAGSLGLSRLWIVDLLIYHRLLDSCFIEGIILEEKYKWLPTFRTNMMETQKGEGVLFKVVGYYLVSIVSLILVAGGSLSVWLDSMNRVASIVFIGITVIIGIWTANLIYSKTENTDAIRKRLEESRQND